MKIVFRKIIFGVVLSVFVLACQKAVDPLITENPLTLKTSDFQDISIEEAKAAFQKYGDGNAATKRNGNKKKWKKSPLWKLARKEKLGRGNSVVIVQLDDSEEKAILKLTPSDSTDHGEQLNTIRKLLVYKNKKGEETMEVMYVVPTNAYHNYRRGLYSDADFTGTLWFENMQGEFLRGSVLRNGRQLYGLTDTGQESTDNARTSCQANTTFVQYDVDWYSIACAGGNCYSQFTHTERVTKVLKYYDCGTGSMSVVVTPESRFTDDDYTQSQLEINYIVNAPKKPINSLKLTLECFGSRQAYADDSRYAFSLTLYNDQPVNETAKLLNLASEDRKPGHTYLGLKRTDKQNGQVVEKIVGFYPEGDWTPMSGMNVSSKWGDDSSTNFDQSVAIQLTSNQFYDVVDRLSGLEVQSTYNPSGKGGKNCTSMAKFIMKDYVVNLPAGMGASPFGYIYTPADFGQDIKRYSDEMRKQQGVTVWTQGEAKSPKSTNCKLNR